MGVTLFKCCFRNLNLQRQKLVTLCKYYLASMDLDCVLDFFL